MKIKKPWHLAASILICELAGIIGSVFTFSAIPTWYATLAKPMFSPPNWVFGPVWTILYALMGVAAYMVWEKGGKHEPRAMKAFGLQLFLNAIWTPVFFGLKDLFAAFVIIALMWAAIVVTMVLFWRVDRKASLLLSPYLAWVTFAAILNYGLAMMNL